MAPMTLRRAAEPGRCGLGPGSFAAMPSSGPLPPRPGGEGSSGEPAGSEARSEALGVPSPPGPPPSSSERTAAAPASEAISDDTGTPADATGDTPDHEARTCGG